MLSGVLSVYGRDSGKKYTSTTLEGHGKLLRGGDLHSESEQRSSREVQRQSKVEATAWAEFAEKMGCEMYRVALGAHVEGCCN